MIKINLLDASGEKRDQIEGRVALPYLEDLIELWEVFKEKYNIGGDEDKSTGGTKDSEVNIASLVIKVVIALSGVLALYGHELSNLPKLQKILNDQELKIKSLNEFNGKAAGAVAEIKKMKKNKIDIENQIESIAALSKKRLRYIKAIDTIQQNIQEKMWITSLKTTGELLRLEGIAHTDTEISSFIEIISKQIQFSEVQLVAAAESTLADATGKRFRTFIINCTLEKIR